MKAAVLALARTTSCCNWTTSLWRHSPSACLAALRLRRFLLVWMSLTSQPPLLPAVYHNIGGLPTRCKTQDVRKAENSIVPGSFAAGGCIYIYVLTTLLTVAPIVLVLTLCSTSWFPFEPQAAVTTAELVKPNSPAEQLPKNVGVASIACMNKFRQGRSTRTLASRVAS